ncbi:hypothetical protein J4226_01015 [Candidatus Pacearchaeota archaeon]|nr:hypothetical protein [Candidatus Pacearchaeota archaeon]
MNKHIWKVDLVLVLVSVFVLMGIVGYARPLVIAPLDEYESVDGEVLFEFDRADVLLIDDNMDFTTPDEYRVAEGVKVGLEPGIYYWKVKGVLGSEIRILTIKSSVELRLVETPDGFSVVNAGNVRLNVDVYNGNELVEKKKLDIGGDIDGGDKFVGGQDG